jgi:Saxitoxin biosynthesis operon protein SxtJ
VESGRHKADQARRSELRQFGLVAGALFIVLLGALIPWLRGHSYPRWPWVVGGVLIVVGAVYPDALRYPFAIWSAAGKLLGWINSRVVLAGLFYVVVTPMGLVMRLMGRDPMARKFEPQAQSYRVASRRAPARGLERPF